MNFPGKFRYELAIAISLLFIFSIDLLLSDRSIGWGLLAIAVLLVRWLYFGKGKTSLPEPFKEFRWEQAAVVIGRFRYELAVAISLLFIFSIVLITSNHAGGWGLLGISLSLIGRLYLGKDKTSLSDPFKEFKWELTVAIAMLFFFSLNLVFDHPIYGSGLLALSLLLARRIRFRERRKTGEA